ncbi:hypothetical protein NST58_20365 [Paenibacillus sp. FSL R10-2796]|uniref:HNH endonuclease n=1 Tax=Paenibacillus TaxID=44249 RepID=UPI00289D8E30|nr:hypothetical protein [Paenibacillus odorifer]
MEVNPKDPIVRYAILEAHGFQCYYTEKSLNMFNATIDHIVPQSYEGKLDELNEYKRVLGHDVDINHLYNLVPATWKINLLKSNKLYEVPHAIFLINRAKEKASEIIKRIQELRNFKDFERYLAAISAYISSSNNPRIEFSKIVELLPEQFGPFENKREVTSEHFSRSLPSVSLMAFLPRIYEQCGSCCFEFRSVFVSDCMITLSHKQITQQLFLGLNTDYKLEKRGFIVGKHFNLPNLYYIQLGNNRFTLKEEEVEDLCKIIDDFGGVFVKRFQSIENKWGVSNFCEFDPYECSVKLIEIKRSLWRKMIEFSWEFDYANGNSEWHIFNRTNGTIMLYPNRIILTRLEPENIESYHYESYMNPDETLWIKWKRYDNRLIKDEEPWTAEQTFHWLTEKFIPYVVYYYELVNIKKRWFEKSMAFLEFSNDFKIDNYIINSSFQIKRDFKLIDSADDLLSEMCSLQMFFSTNPSISLSLEEIKSIFLGIKYILMNIELPNYSYYYIKKKINYSMLEKNNHMDAIALINHKLETIVEENITLGQIGELFKCYIEALKCKNAINNLNKIVIKEVIKLLEPIWERYYFIEYIKRIGKDNN